MMGGTSIPFRTAFVFVSVLALAAPAAGQAQSCDPPCGATEVCSPNGVCVSKCNPICATNQLCSPAGVCVSRCNPPCRGGHACTSAGQCVAHAQPSPAGTDRPGIGIRAGVGTDISGGLGFGGNINYYVGRGLELGLAIFANSTKETSRSGHNPDTGGAHRYDETTDLIVAGVLANYLWGYTSGDGGIFGVAGLGLAVISVDWKECSATDSSLGGSGTGGSCQSADGINAGTVINLGVGFAFSSLDIRLEAPIILLFDAPGESAGFVPTFTGTIGYRF